MMNIFGYPINGSFFALLIWFSIPFIAIAIASYYERKNK